jgi:hypothetical protein
MEKILKGYSYCLDKLIRIEGYKAFLLESDDKQEHFDENGFVKSEEVPCYDLGMRRRLRISGKVYLILIGEEGMNIIEPDPAGCRLSELLKEKGYNSSSIAEYGGRTGEDGKPHGYYWQNWRRALDERKAVFSENGYALQYRGWADYTFYQFELKLLKRGWIRIGGYDIEGFVLWNVTEDIMEKAGKLIEKALLAPQSLSGPEFAEMLKKAELKDQIEYLRMMERDVI